MVTFTVYIFDHSLKKNFCFFNGPEDFQAKTRIHAYLAVTVCLILPVGLLP